MSRDSFSPAATVARASRAARALLLAALLPAALAACRGTNMPTPARTARVELGSDLAYYEVYGDGNPVVLVHGGGVDRRIWDGIVPALSEGFRVVRYDRRGYGSSDEPASPYNEVLDLRTLVDALGFERVHLVGEDAGAAIAVEFALTYPDRVRSLVLAGPAVGGYKYSGRYVAASASIARAYKERGAAAAIDLWLGRKGLFHDSDVSYLPRKRLRALLSENEFVFRAAPRSPREGPPAWRRLHQINVPTLVLVGESESRDPQIIAAAIGSSVAGATLQFVPRAGHMISLEQPELLAEELLTFLRDAEIRPPVVKQTPAELAEG